MGRYISHLFIFVKANCYNIANDDHYDDDGGGGGGLFYLKWQTTDVVLVFLFLFYFRYFVFFCIKT